MCNHEPDGLYRGQATAVVLTPAGIATLQKNPPACTKLYVKVRKISGIKKPDPRTFGDE